jgi:hypothetical protein
VLFVIAFIPRNRPVPFALVHVSREQPRVLGAPRFDEDFATYRQGQVELVKSRAVLTGVVRHGDLAELNVGNSESDRIDWLEDHIRVEVGSDPEVLRIWFTAGSPEDKAKVINAVTYAFIYASRNQERDKRQDRVQRLRDALVECHASIHRLHETLRRKEASPERNGLVDGLTSSHVRSGLVAEDLKAYHQELRRVRLAMIAIRAKAPDQDDATLKDDLPTYKALAKEETLLLKTIATEGQSERDLRCKEEGLESVLQELQVSENLAKRIMVEIGETEAEAHAGTRVSLLCEPDVGTPPMPWYKRLLSLLK